MKQFLILLTAGLLVFAAGTAAAAGPVDLLCIMDGITPGSLEFEEVFFSDPLPENHPESWEIRNDVLYDTEAKILLAVSDEADFGGTLAPEPGTRYIYADAVGMNETIREIVLPDGLEVIGPRALTGAVTDTGSGADIRTVRVPASVRLIQEPVGTSVSSLCCSKPYILVDEKNPRYVSTADGLLIDRTEGAVLWCASFPEARTVAVPEGIRRIAPYAFAGCHEITGVSLPDSLIEIGEGAFRMMSGLEEITIPEKVLRIGADNFCWVGDEEGGQPESGADRRPGIIFRGTDFLLQVSAPDGIYGNNNFSPCFLPVQCPAGALCLDILEEEARNSALPPWRLTIVEADGSTRVVNGE